MTDRVLTVTPRDQLSSTRSSFPSLPGRCTRLFLCCATSLVCLTSLPPTLAVVNLLGTSYHRGYGAMVARLTPDQKVGSSNLSGLNMFLCASNLKAKNKCRMFRKTLQFLEPKFSLYPRRQQLLLTSRRRMSLVRKHRAQV